MATLQLIDVAKTYPNGRQAIAALDLDVDDGELFVIVGPSGCGKTTTLRLVAGLEAPTRGDILIDDVRVNEVSPGKRDVAMAFQDPTLYPHMIVAEIIGFSLKVAGIPKRSITARVDQVATMLDLRDVLGSRPHQLSGGQKQRTALGRAIIREPRLLLMDEPMSSLDTKLRIQTRSHLMRIQRQLETTTIFVTHDQVEAMAIADRVAVMRDGTLVQLGRPMEVYESPDTLFVGEFLGSPPMNLLLASATRRDGEMGFDLSGQFVPIEDMSRWPGLDSMDGRQLAIGIRPESLRPSEYGELDANVDSVEIVGPDQIVRATIKARSVGDQDSTIVIGDKLETSIAIWLPASERVNAWRALHLTIDTTQVHLFDLETGRRVDGCRT